MEELTINLAYINLNLTINKMIFRKRLEPKRSEGIDQQIDDLTQVLNVLKELDTQNKALQRRLIQSELQLMEVNKLNEKLRIYED
jgi:hypothetical protein